MTEPTPKRQLDQIQKILQRYSPQPSTSGVTTRSQAAAQRQHSQDPGNTAFDLPPSRFYRRSLERSNNRSSRARSFSRSPAPSRREFPVFNWNQTPPAGSDPLPPPQESWSDDDDTPVESEESEESEDSQPETPGQQQQVGDDDQVPLPPPAQSDPGSDPSHSADASEDDQEQQGNDPEEPDNMAANEQLLNRIRQMFQEVVGNAISREQLWILDPA